MDVLRARVVDDQITLDQTRTPLQVIRHLQNALVNPHLRVARVALVLSQPLHLDDDTADLGHDRDVRLVLPHRLRFPIYVDRVGNEVAAPPEQIVVEKLLGSVWSGEQDAFFAVRPITEALFAFDSTGKMIVEAIAQLAPRPVPVGTTGHRWHRRAEFRNGFACRKNTDLAGCAKRT